MPRGPVIPTLARLLLALACVLCAPVLRAQPAAQPSPPPAAEPGASSGVQDFSVSEKLLFMANHLAALRPPQTLGYAYRKAGSLEPGFDDRVQLKLSKAKGGVCCDATAEFLTGPRRMPLPPVEGVQGNPVLLYFLERDIREMSRLTKGQSAYFRKRIRMAVYQGAVVEETAVAWRGRSVPATRITIRPYVDDPMRPRFEQLAGKTYTFILSKQVPGEVVLLRARVADPDAAKPPVLLEQLLLDGITLGATDA